MRATYILDKLADSSRLESKFSQFTVTPLSISTVLEPFDRSPVFLLFSGWCRWKGNLQDFSDGLKLKDLSTGWTIKLAIQGFETFPQRTWVQAMSRQTTEDKSRPRSDRIKKMHIGTQQPSARIVKTTPKRPRRSRKKYEYFEADRILNMRTVRGKDEYLVAWANRQNERPEPTWV